MKGKLTPEQVAIIKGSKGVYKQADVARHFGIGRSMVWQIWNNYKHTKKTEVLEPPVIMSNRAPEWLIEDIRTLAYRGLDVDEIASTLQLSTSAVRRVTAAEAR